MAVTSKNGGVSKALSGPPAAQIDPRMAIPLAAVGGPLLAWFAFGDSLIAWALRNRYFTTDPLLFSIPGATPIGAGPTVTTVFALLTLLVAIGAATITALVATGVIAAPDQREIEADDRRRPSPPAKPALLAITTGALAIGTLLATPFVPQILALALGGGIAYAAWAYLGESLMIYCARRRIVAETEWNILKALGFLQLPKRPAVTVTKWGDTAPARLDTEDDDTDEDDHLGLVDPDEYLKTPNSPTGLYPLEYKLRYTGRRDELGPDIGRRLDRGINTRLKLTWATEQQLITAHAAAAEPRKILRLREKIAATTLFESSATVKNIALNEGNEIVSFTVRHHIADKLSGTARDKLIERRVNDLLPGRWRAKNWDHTRETVDFEIRPDLTDLVHVYIPETQPINRTIEQVCANYSDCEITFAINEDGQEITYKPTVTPHGLLIGPTGTGKTACIMTLVAALAHFGMRVVIVDFKGMEYNSLRDYPNVWTVVTEVYEAVTVINKMYTEMRRRYKISRRNKAELRDCEPYAIIIDEYTEFQDRLKSFYRATKPKGGPAECPTLNQFRSILRLARSARMHVFAGLQRPDVEFLKGEARDNFTFRVSLGRLSADAAGMFWNDQWVGRTVPIGIRGRGIARGGKNGEPQEVQVFYTPDPKEPRDATEKRVLAEIYPPGNFYERAVVRPPDDDPETVPEEFGYYQALPILRAENSPQFDELSDLYLPPEWVTGATDGGLFDDEARPNSSQELAAMYHDNIDKVTPTPIADLTIGDYIRIDAAPGGWATLTSEPISIANEESEDGEDFTGMYVLLCHDDNGSSFEVRVAEDQTVDVGRLKEMLLV